MMRNLRSLAPRLKDFEALYRGNALPPVDWDRVDRFERLLDRISQARTPVVSVTEDEAVDEIAKDWDTDLVMIETDKDEGTAEERVVLQLESLRCEIEERAPDITEEAVDLLIGLVEDSRERMEENSRPSIRNEDTIEPVHLTLADSELAALQNEEEVSCSAILDCLENQVVATGDILGRQPQIDDGEEWQFGVSSDRPSPSMSSPNKILIFQPTPSWTSHSEDEEEPDVILVEHGPSDNNQRPLWILANGLPQFPTGTCCHCANDIDNGRESDGEFPLICLADTETRVGTLQLCREGRLDAAHWRLSRSGEPPIRDVVTVLFPNQFLGDSIMSLITAKKSVSSAVGSIRELATRTTGEDTPGAMVGLAEFWEMATQYASRSLGHSGWQDRFL